MSPGGNNATFSSSLLRERDQKILEKHAREKSELELRIQRLKKVNDARSKELFDALHRVTDWLGLLVSITYTRHKSIWTHSIILPRLESVWTG
jgi:hypothetical protein